MIGVHFGMPVIILAIMLYARFTLSRLCLAPVHHITEPHTSVGMLGVWAMWCMASGEGRCLLVRRQSIPAGTIVAEEAAAASALKLNLLSIHSPSDLTGSVVVVWWSYSLIPTMSAVFIVLLLVHGIRCINLTFLDCI